MKFTKQLKKKLLDIFATIVIVILFILIGINQERVAVVFPCMVLVPVIYFMLEAMKADIDMKP